jgi:SH3 domain protein
MRNGIASFAIAFLLAAPVMAQQRYVSDELVITLRPGPSTQNAIIRNLTSGDGVTILEEEEGGTYARVRTTDGTEGWVLTQYLQDSPTGDQLRAAAERDLSAARDRVAALEEDVESLSTDLAAANAELAALRSSEDDLSTELADIRQASASAIEMRDQNQSLRGRVNVMTAELEAATIENGSLRSRKNQNWFIVGAAVLFGGIIIGLVAPSLRPKKRSGW